MSFNHHLAKQMYGANTEAQLRDAINGERSGITELELRQITDKLGHFDRPVYCEVGVYFGGTFRLVMDHLRESGKDHWGIGIDLFEDLRDHVGPEQTHEALNKWNILNVAYMDDLDRSLREKGIENFRLVKGMSHQTLRYLPWVDKDNAENYTPNVIFLDGNHTYAQTMLDFEAAHDVIQDGGFIVFHNASDHIPPDHEYVARDGGPWKVCEDILDRPTVKELARVERCRTFQVNRS